MNRNILIVRRETANENTDGNPDIRSLEHTVSGVVTEAEDSGPLAGVSVILKGTSIGTATDVDGRYSLTLPDGGGILQFSYIGFETREVPVNNQSVINIALSPDVTALNVVVVTALGVTREERSLGYATQQVDGEKLTFTKEQNVLGSLAGEVAGVQVVGSSGASMGGTQKIKIRGVNSITGGDQPLI